MAVVFKGLGHRRQNIQRAIELPIVVPNISSQREILETKRFRIEFDPNWEIDYHEIHLLCNVGQGAFGVVMLANAAGLPQTQVAVKMLKGK